MLDKQDIDGKVRGKIFIQDYSKKLVIEGVQIKEIRNMVGEDGDFSELMRFTPEGESQDFPGFVVRQVNRSKMLPNAIKAWHLHFKQDEIQTVSPEDHLVVGLWDLREKSPTKGQTMKLVLGGGKSHLLYIPKGVAHGYMNVSQNPTTIIYFVSEQFNLEDADEKRLPWDSFKGFWEPTHE
ncbi:MAG TPA: dTDP-4-dehydrorhamnose 3,5-epimerase family protein [Candidatus Saccharimonadales bacterium]|nr:dTDP-4-dehydrorhamnose 3,5-epimerase family protein [Candidatus Saccharimonadales bacterium]